MLAILHFTDSMDRFVLEVKELLATNQKEKISSLFSERVFAKE
jgi:hypothetical protein